MSACPVTLSFDCLLLQYLCCEVAALQQASRLRQLRVFDIAHMGWRLQTACDMEVAINIHKQVRAMLFVLQVTFPQVAPVDVHSCDTVCQLTLLRGIKYNLNALLSGVGHTGKQRGMFVPDVVIRRAFPNIVLQVWPLHPWH